MKLVINATTLKAGGGFQVALSFIQECMHHPMNSYHVFVSKEISLQLSNISFTSNFSFYKFEHSPSSIIYTFPTLRKLAKLEKKICPDCVFTVFGPSYWTPKVPHLLGFAQGYYLYPESVFFKRVGFRDRMKIEALKRIHRQFFIRNANSYYVESEDARQRLSGFLNQPVDSVFSISNTHHQIFDQPIDNSNHVIPRDKNVVRIISIASYYKHKNLEILKEVVPFLLKDTSRQYVFYLTIEQSIFEEVFKDYNESIINLGPISLDSCRTAYHDSDFVILPTLIEIFSASYPEAMKMKKPILTSDLSFAHSICGDAAEYFDPMDPREIAEKIIYLSGNITRQKELIDLGTERLAKFETSHSRAIKLLQVCQKISKEDH